MQRNVVQMTAIQHKAGIARHFLYRWRVAAALTMCVLALNGPAVADPENWRHEWPRTDFTQTIVDLSEIKSGGPPKDGIPAIDSPVFEALSAGRARGWVRSLDPMEPVIALEIEGDARAYPIRIMMWHEIVNDEVGGVPVAVTYCPLCNAALVFDRRTEAASLDFGTTGKLRHSDLVMYDRQSESWWQQFTGEAIVGEMVGTRLALVPSRLESFGRFAERFPDGRVLVPGDPDQRNYGANPYLGYDRESSTPFLYAGSMPDGIEPMERVVAVEITPGHHEAFALSLLRDKGTMRKGDIVLTWITGQSSALDAATVAGGRDVGNVLVQRESDGRRIDIPYDVTFAFAFHAFRPGSPIHTK